MQREKLSLVVDNVEWVTRDQHMEQPCLIVEYDGEKSTLVDRFRKPGASGYTPSDLDLFYRFRPSAHKPTGRGVFAVGDRVTGKLLLEITAPRDRIELFVSAMRQYTDRTEDDPTYRVELWTRTRVAEFETEAFLVYSADGRLIRQQSLIPDWIEI